MATKKKAQEKDIYRIPGPVQLQSFLQKNSKLFNFSELERICSFPSGTLRHICAGSRKMDNHQYQKVQELILPKLCEFVVLLQLYNGQDLPYDMRQDKLWNNWNH